MNVAMGAVMMVMAVVMVVMVVAIAMGMGMGMIMPVVVRMPRAVIVRMPFDRAAAAAANRAHQMTSISLILISSPPSGISFPPPQVGQGSSRWSISTVSMQS